MIWTMVKNAVEWSEMGNKDRVSGYQGSISELTFFGTHPAHTRRTKTAQLTSMRMNDIRRRTNIHTSATQIWGCFNNGNLFAKACRTSLKEEILVYTQAPGKECKRVTYRSTRTSAATTDHDIVIYICCRFVVDRRHPSNLLWGNCESSWDLTALGWDNSFHGQQMRDHM